MSDHLRIMEIWIKVMKLKDEIASLKQRQLIVSQQYEETDKVKFSSKMKQLENSVKKKSIEMEKLQALEKQRKEASKKRKRFYKASSQYNKRTEKKARTDNDFLDDVFFGNV